MVGPTPYCPPKYDQANTRCQHNQHPKDIFICYTQASKFKVMVDIYTTDGTTMFPAQIK